MTVLTPSLILKYCTRLKTRAKRWDVYRSDKVYNTYINELTQCSSAHTAHTSLCFVLQMSGMGKIFIYWFWFVKCNK